MDLQFFVQPYFEVRIVNIRRANVDSVMTQQHYQSPSSRQKNSNTNIFID